MRYQHIQTILTGLLCGILLVSLTSQAAGSTEKQSYLKLALTRPIASLAPYDKDCHQEIAGQLFAGLTELASDTLKAVPSLAARWEVSEDGIVYTFFLRQDAQWSNQEPLTAYHVEKTVRWYLNGGSDDPEDLFILKNAKKFFDVELDDESLLGVRAIDDHTVRFTLEYPTPLFPVMTSLLHFRPLPVERIQEAAENWTHPKHILVSGPYMLKRWRKRNFLILEENPAYFDAAKVQIPEIHYTMLPSSEVALEMYKRNQLDFMPFFQKKQWQEIQNFPDFRSNGKAEYRKQDKLETWYLGFNRSLPPFDQAPVREAVATAIDKQLLLKKILGVIGKTADSFTSPSGIGYVASDDMQCRHKFSSDHLVRARKLLQQAYPSGEKIPDIYIRGGSSDADTVIQLLKEMLKKNLGISIQEKTEKVWRESDASPHLFVTSKTAALPHAHYFLSEFSAADNRTAWTDEKHEEFKALLINALVYPSDSAQQKKLYQQAETILCEELVIVPLFFRDIAFLAKQHQTNPTKI
ncbi:MAG: peptide ABC transporter substrate-binding protein, partial [Candidatus Electrothrix sp. EH2]|nr:peptide ABC transporter substrate-binding protein [Candidatus Electrothrix sp. EH2]